MRSRNHYLIRWSASASMDLQSIIGYLANEDLLQAERVLAEIEQAATSLSLLPRRGRVVPELKEYGMLLYRELIHAPWRVLYRIEARTVFILAVFDGRRNLEDILLQRFLQ